MTLLTLTFVLVMIRCALGNGGSGEAYLEATENRDNPRKQKRNPKAVTDVTADKKYPTLL